MLADMTLRGKRQTAGHSEAWKAESGSSGVEVPSARGGLGYLFIIEPYTRYNTENNTEIPRYDEK